MIQANVSLKPYNTFGVEAAARFFAEAHTVEQLQSILGWYRDQENLPLLILGGGSNILFTKDWDGLALKLNLKGKDIIEGAADSVLVSAGAGEDWHEFVAWTLDQGLNGFENLSLIPGNVGASPMQNIGAYGVEVKDVFDSLEAIHFKTGERKTFTARECEFGYRDSIFKQAEKGNWIIVSVTFALKTDQQVKIDYGAIESVLKGKNIKNPTPKQVSEAVIEIRQSKLPDPKRLGSAGSFFKNPVITKNQLTALQKQKPDLPFYQAGEAKFKVPAGYLIEQLGWKGKTFGHCGVHETQALVLVNYGGASGAEILDLARQIQASVKKAFAIDLELEVNLI